MRWDTGALYPKPVISHAASCNYGGGTAYNKYRAISSQRDYRCKSQDYVKTARSKGLPIDKVYTHHIFRNSLLPIAAFFGFTVTGLLAGSIFVETIFMYQGMGMLFIESIMSRDYSVINALTLLYGTLALFGSLISDIIMIIVDPRIRIE